jgi:Putative prokaryotic signal transducing protein
MKCVFTARDAFEANFVGGLLEQVGIHPDVRNENLGEVFPWVASMLPKLFVKDEDVERAEEIVEEYRQKLLRNAEEGRPVDPVGVETAERWRCACGEEHDATFSSCWRCGREAEDLPL